MGSRLDPAHRAHHNTIDQLPAGLNWISLAPVPAEPICRLWLWLCSLGGDSVPLARQRSAEGTLTNGISPVCISTMLSWAEDRIGIFA